MSQRDEDVFRYVQAHHLVIVTRDDDFRTRFAPPHAGIIIIQASNTSRNTDILACLLAQLPTVLANVVNDAIRVIECSS